jgi:very-short-patch-repair endonuclease
MRGRNEKCAAEEDMGNEGSFMKNTPTYVVSLAKQFRKEPTKAEDILWEQIRKSKLKGFKFRRQAPIGRYIAAFYCPEVKLVIEIDGKVHDLSENMEYDIIRQISLESGDNTVIRFKNEEVIFNLSSVLEQIEKSLLACSRNTL